MPTCIYFFLFVESTNAYPNIGLCFDISPFLCLKINYINHFFQQIDLPLVAQKFTQGHGSEIRNSYIHMIDTN